MKVWTLLLTVLAIILIISVFSIWFVPSSHDFMAGNSTWNGIKDNLKQFNSVLIPTLNHIPKSPEESILISIPYLNYNQSDLDKLKQYVENGGTLLLLDDYGFGNQVLEYLGVETRFDGRPLLDPLFCYNDPWLPKITDFPFEVKPLLNPLFLYVEPGSLKISPFSPIIGSREVTLVVLNHATALDKVSDDCILALSSPTSFLDTNENGEQSPNESSSPYPVAARLELGKGELVLISDPSVLLNSMLNMYDNSSFIKVISKFDSTKTVFFDVSHLSETPLDILKSGIATIRDMLAQSYPTLAVIGATFVSVSWFVLRTGGSIGK